MKVCFIFSTMQLKVLLCTMQLKVLRLNALPPGFEIRRKYASLTCKSALGLAKTIQRESFQIRIKVLESSRHQMIIFIIIYFCIIAKYLSLFLETESVKEIYIC